MHEVKTRRYEMDTIIAPLKVGKNRVSLPDNINVLSVVGVYKEELDIEAVLYSGHGVVGSYRRHLRVRGVPRQPVTFSLDTNKASRCGTISVRRVPIGTFTVLSTDTYVVANVTAPIKLIFTIARA